MKEKHKGHKRKWGGGFDLTNARNGLQQAQNLQGNLLRNANNGLQQAQNLQGNLLRNANNGLQQARSLTGNIQDGMLQVKKLNLKDVAKSGVKLGKTVAMLSNPITAVPAAMKLKHQLSEGLQQVEKITQNPSKTPIVTDPSSLSATPNATIGNEAHVQDTLQSQTQTVKPATAFGNQLHPNQASVPNASTVTKPDDQTKTSSPVATAPEPTPNTLNTPSAKEEDEDPIKKLMSDQDKIVKELQDVLADTNMPPDAKTSKVGLLEEKLEQVANEANALEDGMKNEAVTTTENIKQSGGEVVDASDIQVRLEERPNTNGGVGTTNQNDIANLETIQKEAFLEIAKADVKLVYDYVQKTSDPRALKAIFEYQQGRENNTDKLSKHLAKVKEIISPLTPSNPSKRSPVITPALIKKAVKLERDIQLARVKLYSVNVEAALRRIEDQEAEVSFFPDELKTEMTEKQKRITTAILVIFTIVKYVFKQFAKAPTVVSVFTILCLIVVLYSAYLALKYCIMIISDFTNNKLINNPTNAESLDFLIANFGNSPPRNVNPDKSSGENARTDSRSATEIKIVENPVVLFFVDMFKKAISPLFGNLLSAKYKYALFVILPWISLIFALLAIFFMIRKRKQLELTPGVVQAFLYAAMVQTIIALFANYAVFFYAYYVLRGTSARIDNYNKLVLASMSQRADFLAYLQKLPTNTIDIANVTTQALTSLFARNAVPSESDLSKAVFTLNLYEHYQQLGYRNPVLYEALDSFRIYNFIFSQQSFSPALYLRRRSTIIRDNSEKYRSIITSIYRNTGRSMDSVQQMIDNALMRSSQMTAEANNMANTFYPEDAMSRFLRMAIIIANVQFLPFIIFFYLFRNRDLRNGFIDAIRIMMGQKKKAGEADLRDQEETVLELREMMHNKGNEKDQQLPKPPTPAANPPVAVI